MDFAFGLFKFKVKHTRWTDNVVADALSRMFEGGTEETTENCCMALWQELPLVYSSLETHQEEDSFCTDLRGKILAGEASVDKFQVQGNRLSYYPKGAKRRRWVVPAAMKMMILKYFHESVLSGQLRARKTFQRITAHFWWLLMRAEIFHYVRKCKRVPLQTGA